MQAHRIPMAHRQRRFARPRWEHQAELAGAVATFALLIAVVVIGMAWAKAGGWL